MPATPADGTRFRGHEQPRKTPTRRRPTRPSHGFDRGQREREGDRGRTRPWGHRSRRVRRTGGLADGEISTKSRKGDYCARLRRVHTINRERLRTLRAGTVRRQNAPSGSRSRFDDSRELERSWDALQAEAREGKRPGICARWLRPPATERLEVDEKRSLAGRYGLAVSIFRKGGLTENREEVWILIRCES